MSKTPPNKACTPSLRSSDGTNCADPAPLHLAPQACGVAGQAGGIRTAKLAFFVALDFGCFVGESRPSSRRPVA